MNNPFQFLGDENAFNNAFQIIRTQQAHYSGELRAIEIRMANFEKKRKSLETQIQLISKQYSVQEKYIKAVKSMGNTTVINNAYLELLSLNLRKLKCEETLLKFDASHTVELTIKKGVAQYAMTGVKHFKNMLIEKANELGIIVPPDSND